MLHQVILSSSYVELLSGIVELNRWVKLLYPMVISKDYVQCRITVSNPCVEWFLQIIRKCQRYSIPVYLIYKKTDHHVMSNTYITRGSFECKQTLGVPQGGELVPHFSLSFPIRT